tara:strand:+ start:1334 stop:1462 length:129 start_codon:yes stop_codon:yes gene_type:complete
MIRDAVSFVATGVLGFAVLGLIGVVMLRDSLGELQVATSKKR